MCYRVLARPGAVMLVVAVGLWAPALVAGQAPGQAPSGTAVLAEKAISTDEALKAAIEAGKAANAAVRPDWTAPRTSWGDPDLQGYWNFINNYTPLQRPRPLGTKAFYTEQEAGAALKRAVDESAEVDPRTVHYDWNEFGMRVWQMPDFRLNLRTSMVVDPPDGRIPPLTPEAEKRVAADSTAAAERANVTSPGLYTRCFVGNGGPPRVPGGNNSEAQILQIPGYVVIFAQSGNDARIVPLDGRPHLPKGVGQWLGDARGRWEGNTLVVETTNFHPDRPWLNATANANWGGSTDGLNLVERFTLVAPQTLRYEFAVSDPATWTKPWSLEAMIPRTNPPIYEWACHEENYGLINYAKGMKIRKAEALARGEPAPQEPSGYFTDVPGAAGPNE